MPKTTDFTEEFQAVFVRNKSTSPWHRAWRNRKNGVVDQAAKCGFFGHRWHYVRETHLVFGVDDDLCQNCASGMYHT